MKKQSRNSESETWNRLWGHATGITQDKHDGDLKKELVWREVNNILRLVEERSEDQELEE